MAAGADSSSDARSQRADEQSSFSPAPDRPHAATEPEITGMCPAGTVDWLAREDLLGRIVTSVPVAIAVLNGPELRFVSANPAYQAILGPDVPLIGRRYAEVFPQAAASGSEEEILAVMRTGRPWRVSEYATELPGREGLTWWQGEVLPLPNAGGVVESVLVLASEITERKRIEAAQDWNARRSELLSQTAARLLESPDPQSVVEELCRDVLAFLDCQVFFNYLIDERSGRLRLNAYAGISEQDAESIAWMDQGQAICGCVARDARRIIAERISSGEDPRAAPARAFGIEACCCHPLVVRGVVIGTLFFGARGRDTLRDDEVEVMGGVANLVAMAMHRIRVERSVRESEAWLRLVTDAAPALISYVDDQGRYRFVNKGYEDWFGIDRSVCIGRHLRDVLGDRAYAQVEPHMRRVLSGEPVQFEVELSYSSGARFVRANYVPDIQPDGSVAGFFALVADITQNKRSAEALLLSARQQRAVAQIGEFSLTHETQETLDFASALVAGTLGIEFCKVLELQGDRRHMLLRSGVGWRPGLIGTATVDTGEHSQAGHTLASNEAVTVIDLASEKRFEASALLVEHGVVSGMSCVIRLPDGGVWGVLGTHARRRIEFSEDDISFLTAVAHVLGTAIEHRRAEVALRDSEQRLRLALEAGRMGTWEWDVRTNTVAWSHGLEIIHGLEPGTFPGTFEAYCRDMHPDDRERILGTLAESLRTTGDHHVEYRIVLPDGTMRWVEGRGKLFRDETGMPARMVGVCADITQRKQFEQSLQDSEERYRSLVSVITDVPWTADAAGAFTSHQPAWSAYTGQSGADMHGLGWMAAVHGDDRPRLRAAWERALGSGDAYECRARLWHAASGEHRHVVARAVPVRYPDGSIREWVGSCTDVDEQVRASEHLERMVAERTRELEATHQRLRMSERMASLGTLSAGLGHDMGNLLVPVRVRLESLEGAALPESARDDINAIRKSAEYLQKLANGLRLLALDPSRSPARETTGLNEWWSDAQGVMRSVLPRGMCVEARIPEEAGEVAISRAALTQVVFNLVQNAGDAMKERGSGTVTITARAEDGRVRLTVADDGPGMTDQVRARCMEPFFTTKARGISTGLGLPLVHALVTEAGGRVEIESEPGRGTSFVLFLPIASAPAAAVGNGGRCAVVELKDQRLRSFVAGELKMLDFEVRNGGESLGAAALFVVDDPARAAAAPCDAKVILLGVEEGGPAHAISVGPRPTFRAVREAIRNAAADVDGRMARAEPGAASGSARGSGMKDM